MTAVAATAALPTLPVAPSSATDTRPQPNPRDGGAETEGARGFARALGAARGGTGRADRSASGSAAKDEPAASTASADDAEATPRTAAGRARRQAVDDGAEAPDGSGVAPEPPPLRWPWQALARAGAGTPDADAATGAAGRRAIGADNARIGAAAGTAAKAGSGPAAQRAGTGIGTATGAGADAGLRAGTGALAGLTAAEGLGPSPTDAIARASAPRGGDGGGFATALAAALPNTVAAGAAAPGGTPAAAAAEATLASPPGSAGFAAELSARLTTFVRDGIEQARLHLNPADMGPVEVRIALDGDAARVTMSAEQAPTRQWLEQALPTLAGSLREAGLTLAGGGVFEQAPGGQGAGQGRGDAPAPGARSGEPTRGDESPGTATAALPAPRRRGVVDLVA